MGMPRLMPKCILVILIAIFCAIYETDSSTYHVTFLGRNQPASNGVGLFLIQTTGNLPNISHKISSSCLYNTSDWGLGAEFFQVAFSSSECTQLIPNGTEQAPKGIKVESPDDITLHVIQSDSSGGTGDGFLAIPDEHLGTDYYIITYCTTGGTCQFAVAGIADNTTVNIVFPNNTKTGVVCVNGSPSASEAPASSAIPFTINEFDILHFESEQDLSGTYIHASEKIGVFVGARDIPQKNGFVSEIAEQIPPVSKWGTEFVVVPNFLNDEGDIVKIVTKTDNTVITTLGFTPVNIPFAGEAVEQRIDWHMYSTIHASNPVLIVQIMNLNLYNGSNTTGSAAMVFVQHVQQWVATNNSFHCHVSSADNRSLIAVISKSDTTHLVSILPTPTVNYSTWNVIGGGHFEAMVFKPVENETTIGGTLLSAYGYCEGGYALLLAANWTWENEECVPTAPSPGDDVDNDCDGQIDEDNCTTADLEISFTSLQNSSGDISFKTFDVRGAGYVDVKITTCDIAMLTLKTITGDTSSITIKISPSLITAQICIGECFPAYSHTINITNCEAPQQYTIEWFEDEVGLQHVFHTANSEYHWGTNNTFGVVYDKLIVSAAVGTADFLVGLPEKDCNKIVLDLADTAGVKFILPVENSDDAFWILLYTKSDLVSPITVELSVNNSIGIITMNANETKTISKSDITEQLYKKITLTITGGEVFVYIRRINNLIATGLVVLPTDVLGPSYHLFHNISIDATNLTARVCNVFATDRTALSDGYLISVHDHAEMTVENLNDLEDGLLTADRPLAVFCGTFNDTLVQMPPRESLGRQFYIPNLNLTSMNADADIYIVATEYSTVVTIRGDYDQMDPVSLVGNVYHRNVVPNTIYNITTSKPVQVVLQVRSTADGWGSAVVIPPIEQYNSENVFPGFDPLNFELTFSSAIDTNGQEVSSQVTSAALIQGKATTFQYSNGPVFSLTVVSSLGNPGHKYIVPSNVLYKDINEVCTLTAGTPGDGIDNDCDGLIDEEHCSDSTEPGTFDYDLDGALNEDCSAQTNATVFTTQLSVPLDIVTCILDTNNATASENEGIVIENTYDDVQENSSVIEPVITDEGTEAPYNLVIQSAATISIPTTTPAAGSTAPPEETCVTDCICPCGWVNPPQNYTAEQLEAIIVEIQEKLRVSKAELSATIRRKTSAPDDRPSAAAVGYIGLVSIIVTLTTVALLDVTTLFRDVRILMDNVRQVFQP